MMKRWRGHVNVWFGTWFGAWFCALKAKLSKGIYPQSLYGRLALVWLLALGVGHLIQNIYSYMSIYDDQIARADYYLAQDLSLLLPILEHASPAEREVWVKKMRRHAYHYELTPLKDATLFATSTPLAASELTRHRVSAPVKQELAQHYQIRSSAGLHAHEMRRFYFVLADQTVLQAILHQPVWPVDWWEGLVFSLQVFVVLGFTWLAVRQVTQPLRKLADATSALGHSLQGEALAEDGPSEVARAAAAFNTMQAQIKKHLAERVQILAAIAHDLQTPLTRMRLRVELMDAGELQKKLQADLSAMQNLVEEGVTFARSAQRSQEDLCWVDIDALLDSMVYDYLDAQQTVSLSGSLGRVMQTRPQSLKRILINLCDNALKFAGAAEIQVQVMADHRLSLAVLDRGPGIPEEQLQAVLEPFYRLEHSRNRTTGGTGLGLAIAQQLAQALDAELVLSKRDGGGLCARLILPMGEPAK